MNKVSNYIQIKKMQMEKQTNGDAFSWQAKLLVSHPAVQRVAVVVTVL